MKNIILVGLPASGKSEIRKKLVAESGPFLVMSTDDRIQKDASLKGLSFNDAMKIADREMWQSLENHDWSTPILWDQTNLGKKKRSRIIKAFKRLGSPFETEFLFVDTPIDVCLARNSERPESTRVPEEVMMKMHANMQPPTKEELE